MTVMISKCNLSLLIEVSTSRSVLQHKREPVSQESLAVRVGVATARRGSTSTVVAKSLMSVVVSGL